MEGLQTHTLQHADCLTSKELSPRGIAIVDIVIELSNALVTINTFPFLKLLECVAVAGMYFASEAQK